MREENKVFRNSFYLNRWGSFSLLFVIVFICVFPPYWATGILGQHRTLNVAYAFFLPFWFINLTVWFNFYEEKIRLNISKKGTKLLAVFLLLGVLFPGNGYYALSDLISGSAQNYDKQLNNRFVTLKNTSKTKNRTIMFKPLKMHPKSLFSSDITDNPSNWKNQAYNLYFRKGAVKIYVGVRP